MQFSLAGRCYRRVEWPITLYKKYFPRELCATFCADINPVCYCCTIASDCQFIINEKIYIIGTTVGHDLTHAIVKKNFKKSKRTLSH